MKKHTMLYLLVFILILSLGFIGIGYGLWSQTLVIDGTVYTGEVDAFWESAGCFEFYPWESWPTIEFYGEAEGKDVGWWNVWIDQQDNHILHFEIHNGYPSYAVDCQVHFRVGGTIPVYVRGTMIQAVSDNLTNCEITGNNQKILSCDQLTVIFTDNLGSQLHPGDGAASSLTVHIEQLADELAIYEFDVGVCMAQWNEFATPEQCFAASP